MATTTNEQYREGAQTLIAQIRTFRQQIPKLQIPDPGRTRRNLSNAASVPPEFIEFTSVMVRNSASLVRAGADPDQSTDLMSYAEAYGPVADELESLAHFVRHSVATAKNEAGSDALTTYALAQRLARRKATADLAPHVADMRRLLKRTRKAKAAPPAGTPAAGTPAPAPQSPMCCVGVSAGAAQRRARTISPRASRAAQNARRYVKINALVTQLRTGGANFASFTSRAAIVANAS
jgi:hypothetical protein